MAPDYDVTSLTVQLTQTAMGDKGGWIQASDDITKFMKAVHKTLNDLRYPPQQPR
jgi:hypothetical protein